MDSLIEKKSFYSNSSKVMATAYDIGIIFDRTRAPEVPATVTKSSQVVPVIAESLEVSMSPSHAKAVVIGLLNAVLDYEKNIGSIPLPADKQTAFDDLLARVKEIK